MTALGWPQCANHFFFRLLLHGNESIISIATQVGFCDQSHFSTHCKRLYGVTPRVFIQQIAQR